MHRGCRAHQELPPVVGAALKESEEPVTERGAPHSCSLCGQTAPPRPTSPSHACARAVLEQTTAEGGGLTGPLNLSNEGMRDRGKSAGHFFLGSLTLLQVEPRARGRCGSRYRRHGRWRGRGRRQAQGGSSCVFIAVRRCRMPAPHPEAPQPPRSLAGQALILLL